MQVTNISPNSLYTRNSLKKTVPAQNNVLSFKAGSKDKKIASDYFRRYSTMLSYENETEGKEFIKQTKNFFKELRSENKNVQKEFLLTRIAEHESVFAQAMYANYLDAVNEILKLYADADEKTRASFLVPNNSQTGSPFFIACDYDNSLEVAKTLRKMIKTLSPENQGKFYYRTSESLWGNQNTIAEELKDSGYLVFGQEIEADKNKFDKKYPQIAIKLQKKYPPIYPQIPLQNFKNDETTKTEPKTQKSVNFKVFEKVKTRFSDVGGMFNVKKQIENELLNILDNPRVKNVDKPSGIILFGSPGTGKTLLATAIAGEADVPFISTNGSSFNEIYVGAGAKHVREIFNEARELAKKSYKKTAIIFIDEADAIAAKRESSNNSESNHTLNALLGEMDGVQSKEENDIKIITILATNRKDLFDDAFRKGRIDLEFQIDDPRFSTKARREILEINAKDKPFKNKETKKQILNELAQSSSGMSGAELADIIKRAYRKTLYLDRENEYITPKDISEAKLEALIGIKNDNENTEFEQKQVIAHEAGHAINQLIMNRIFADENQKSKTPTQKLDFIVNESRGNVAGLTMMKPSPDNQRLTVESLMSSLVVNYGGYSTEEKLFDGHTDGVSSDLEHSTNLILKSVTKWGLGSKTKYIGCTPNGVSFELFKGDIKQDIIDYSDKAMSISNQITEFSAPFIEDYVNTFLNEKDDKFAIITGEKFEQMFDEWLQKNGNKSDFKKLCNEIRESISNFKQKIKS